VPTLRQLEYLVAVADARSFRRAAERVNTTQPTLSEQLKALEERIGAQLVERSHSRVVLTPVGLEVLEIARRMLRDAQEIKAIASGHSGRLAGIVRVGLSPTIGPYMLPRIVPELRSRYPDLRLYVREEPPSVLARGLDEGSLDVIVVQLPVRSADFVSVSLFREPIYVAMAADHRIASKPVLRRSDLAGEEVLTLGPDFQLHDFVRTLAEELGAHVRLDFEGTSLDTLREMVATGLGITFLPALYVQSVVSRDPTIVTRELQGRALYRSIGMLWRKSSARQDHFNELAALSRGIIEKELMVPALN
jgi:LysR family hydrogen peroxide-inducible transcriptional activator